MSGEEDFGLTLIRFTRPLTPSDVGVLSPLNQATDLPISVAAGVETYIAWALGPIDPPTGNPFFHTLGYTGVKAEYPVTLEFGRAVSDNCQPLAVVGATDAPTATPPPL